MECMCDGARHVYRTLDHVEQEAGVMVWVMEGVVQCTENMSGGWT